ncbi:hypothetical protein KSP40_PGU009839 [Platanthera guangdongensis]|uniref:Uncharacterized protein n=1 Tax=Platanthera guangdongensis TaxID=2320717 RepID=A0ABR2MPT6_9ASPA
MAEFWPYTPSNLVFYPYVADAYDKNSLGIFLPTNPRFSWWADSLRQWRPIEINTTDRGVKKPLPREKVEVRSSPIDV